MGGLFKSGKGPLLNEWAWMGMALLVIAGASALTVCVVFAADCMVRLLA